jgi:hypothetical protein
MARGAGRSLTAGILGFAHDAAIVQTVASNHVLGVGAFIAALGFVLYLSARIQVYSFERWSDGRVTGVFRGLPRQDVRGHGRDILGARRVRLDGNAEFWPVSGSASIWGSAR